jgi:hypothetical protein
MRTITRIWLLAACLTLANSGLAQAQELQTTTEFEVTLTPTIITDGLQETQEFWVPVLRYIRSDDFTAGDAKGRKAATAFFERLHEALYKQLFEADEETARDLLDYFCLRLRKYIIYRHVREDVKNDVAMAALMDEWEKDFRDVNVLPKADREAKVEAILKALPGQMAALGVSAADSEKAMKWWKLEGKCMTRMSNTKAGALITTFEHDARQMDRPIGELLRDIASAADWALITKTGDKSISRPEFEKAWKNLAELRAKHLATTQPAEKR